MRSSRTFKSSSALVTDIFLERRAATQFRLLAKHICRSLFTSLHSVYEESFSISPLAEERTAWETSKDSISFWSFRSLQALIMAEFNKAIGGGTDISICFDNAMLSPELLEKAERELMEKPSWRDRDVQALRDMISDDPDLVSRSDDAFLLRFLRARKFDYTRSFSLIQNYYRMRAKNATMFKDFTPSSLKHVHKLNLQGFLPYRDPEGRAVFVFRGGMWDPSMCSADDLFRANVICLEKQIDDPLTQINGVVAVLDMKYLGFHHVRHFSPTHALKIVSLVQDSFPARFKAVHIVNEPALFDIVLTIVKPLISEKIKRRIYAHGSNLKSLHEHIPPTILPLEFGGELGPFDNSDFMESLAEEEETFIQSQMYGYISQIAEKGVKKSVSLDAFSPYRRVCIR